MALHGLTIDRRGFQFVAGLLLVGFVARQAYVDPAFFAQPFDKMGTLYVNDIVAHTPADEIIVAPWVYGTPLTFAAYAERRTRQRLILLGDLELAHDVSASTKGKLPVYVISEKPIPSSKARLLEHFHLNPDRDRNPSLFVLRSGL